MAVSVQADGRLKGGKSLVSVGVQSRASYCCDRRCSYLGRNRPGIIYQISTEGLRARLPVLST